MKQLLAFLVIAVVITSCGGNSGSSGATIVPDSLAAARAARDSILAKNKATAIASVEAFSSGNVDAMLKDCTPDAVDYGDGSGAPIKNIDTVKAGIKAWLAAIPDYKAENLMAMADGNHVVVFADWSGTFKGTLMGMKPTGKSFKVKDADLFTFNDAGKITEHRGVQSFNTIIMQIGAKMAK
jgi:predicted ester cyclase